MIKLTPVKGGFHDKIKRLSSTDNKANVGWFASDGQHPTADMTFAELARYHATGSNGVPVRDVLEITKAWYTPRQHRDVIKAAIKYFHSGSTEDLAGIIEAIGESYWKEAMNTIGTDRLPVTGNPTPLYDTGELESHLKFNTTKEPSPKRGSIL